jgi:hypothetical protein
MDRIVVDPELDWFVIFIRAKLYRRLEQRQGRAHIKIWENSPPPPQSLILQPTVEAAAEPKRNLEGSLRFPC